MQKKLITIPACTSYYEMQAHLCRELTYAGFYTEARYLRGLYAHDNTLDDLIRITENYVDIILKRPS